MTQPSSTRKANTHKKVSDETLMTIIGDNQLDSQADVQTDDNVNSVNVGFSAIVANLKDNATIKAEDRSMLEIAEECAVNNPDFFVIQRNIPIVRASSVTYRNDNIVDITTKITMTVDLNKMDKSIYPGVFGTVFLKEKDALGRNKTALGFGNLVTTTSYSLASAMSRCDVRLAMVSRVVRDMKKLPTELTKGASAVVDLQDDYANKIFAGATIDILCQYVPARTKVTSPFASDKEGKDYDHDMILHHVIGIRLGPIGEAVVAKLIGV